MLVTGRKLPIGIQTFEDIRNDGYLYVDKTALMWTIANIGKPFFLSRPRRFGKSLLISTFEAYFKGRRELFTGLAVEELEKKWEVHHSGGFGCYFKSALRTMGSGVWRRKA